MTHGWRILIAGLTVWLAHFSLVWMASSIFGSSARARLIVLVATIAALAAVALIAWRARKEAGDAVDRWMRSLGLLGCATAGLAILWQGLPAALN